MTDVVQTEAEAIKLAEALLEQAETYRKERAEIRSKEAGEDISSFYIQCLYTLQEVMEYPQGWIFIFLVEDVEDSVIDPDTKTISVNKVTGEVKFGYFRDE